MNPEKNKSQIDSQPTTLDRLGYAALTSGGVIVGLEFAEYITRIGFIPGSINGVIAGAIGATVFRQNK